MSIIIALSLSRVTGIGSRLRYRGDQSRQMGQKCSTSKPTFSNNIPVVFSSGSLLPKQKTGRGFDKKRTRDSGLEGVRRPPVGFYGVLSNRMHDNYKCT